MVTIEIDIPDELHRDLLKILEIEEITISEFLTTLIETRVEEFERTKRGAK